jgi:hypothetical protein
MYVKAGCVGPCMHTCECSKFFISSVSPALVANIINCGQSHQVDCSSCRGRLQALATIILLLQCHQEVGMQGCSSGNGLRPSACMLLGRGCCVGGYVPLCLELQAQLWGRAIRCRMHAQLQTRVVAPNGPKHSCTKLCQAVAWI